jgi:choline dehydrogenase-like flavoprotein
MRRQFDLPLQSSTSNSQIGREFRMSPRNYDIITVGGGIAASALAKAMAERGARIRTLFQDTSPEAAALRTKTMPLIAEDPTRVPDHIFSGPDLPCNEQVRARFFGEC